MLDLHKGDRLVLTEAVRQLQCARGGGPCAPKRRKCSSGNHGSVDEVLESLATLNLTAADGSSNSTGEQHLRIVDFVPASVATEEEISLGTNITLKLGAKPKLEKYRRQCGWSPTPAS